MRGLAQGARRPCQQGQHLKQFFGVAAGNAAFAVDVSLAGGGKGGNRRRHQLFHPDQGNTGIDQTRQRLEPG